MPGHKIPKAPAGDRSFRVGVAKLASWIRYIGATSIFAAFIPSMRVYYHPMPAPVVKAGTDFSKSSDFLHPFIAAVIVGGVLRHNTRQ